MWPYCLFPGCIVAWARSLAEGQYIVSWLLTGAPEQGQNRESANVGQDSSVGRAPARQSGGRRLKSRSRKCFLVHPNLSKNVFSQSVFLVVYYMIKTKLLKLTVSLWPPMTVVIRWWNCPLYQPINCVWPVMWHVMMSFIIVIVPLCHCVEFQLTRGQRSIWHAYK